MESSPSLSKTMATTVPSTIQERAVPVQGELRQLITLALPMMGAQLAQVGMGVVDTVMAGRLSAVDLAGVALGSSVLWPVTLMCMGVLQAITPTVAQLNGARHYGEIGENIRQGLWLAMLFSGLVCLLITHAGPYYRLMGVDPTVITVSLPYLRASAFGVPAILWYFVLRFFVEGLGYTRPAMVIAVSALLLKIPLNYLFIYGALGLPKLGGVGCGVASAIIMWFECFAMLVVATRHRFNFAGWRSRFTWPRKENIRKLLNIGIPIGATVFFEVGFFTFITVLIGRFGADSVAAHSIAMSLGSITFMIPFALGMASTIRIGFNVGAGNWHLARRSAGVAVVCALTVAVIAALIVVFGRHVIASLYSHDAAVTALATRLMLFVAVYQVFDCSQTTAIGALRGFKDTRVPMLITLVGYWFVGLPLAMTLGFGWLGKPMHIYGFWVGLSLALAFVATLVCYRLWRVSRWGLALEKWGSE